MERKLIILDCALIWNDNTKINPLSTNDAYFFFISYFENLKSTDVLYLHYTEFVGQPFSQYNFGQENSLDIKLLQNVLEKNDCKLYVVYGGYDCLRYENMPDTDNIKILHWPTFLLHYTYYNVLKKFDKIPNISENFYKLFITLNNKPKQHRGLLLDGLYKNNLFPYGIYTWNELTNEWSNNFKFKYWQEKIVRLDINKEVSDFRFDFLTDEILNSNSLFNIVGETLDNNDMFFITEKTYKNLLFGQPFVCIGSPYQNVVLKNFGFELYDEILNYDFDEKLLIEDRVELLVQNIDKLKLENYNLLYKKIEKKVEYNKNRALEIIKKDNYIPEKLLNLYIKNRQVFEEYKNSYMYTHEYLNKIFSFCK